MDDKKDYVISRKRKQVEVSTEEQRQVLASGSPWEKYTELEWAIRQCLTKRQYKLPNDTIITSFFQRIAAKNDADSVQDDEAKESFYLAHDLREIMKLGDIRQFMPFSVELSEFLQEYNDKSETAYIQIDDIQFLLYKFRHAKIYQIHDEEYASYFIEKPDDPNEYEVIPYDFVHKLFLLLPSDICQNLINSGIERIEKTEDGKETTITVMNE
jgi:hypothetical protein